MKKLSTGILLLLISLSSCKHEPDTVVKEIIPIDPSVCDTTNTILYVSHIKPLFDSKCNYCHGASASTTGGGIALTDSASIVTWYKAGRLIGSIRHQLGYSAMPKSANALTECQIRTIEIWLEPIPVIPPDLGSCNPDTAYFANTIGPLVASTCGTTGCHDVNGSAEGRNLTTYSGIMNSGWVKVNNAAGSKLYTYSNYKVTGKDPMPPSGPSMSAANIALLAKWINQGAKNNSCVSACDTASVTYSGSVKPYTDLTCVGCHNSSNASGSVNLDGYSNFSSHADRSLIRMRSTTNPMPPSGKASDCASRTVEIWIQAGKPNN